jgi:hypothetical protein
VLAASIIRVMIAFMTETAGASELSLNFYQSDGAAIPKTSIVVKYAVRVFLAPDS